MVMTYKFNCPNCGAPISEGKRCEYCGTYYAASFPVSHKIDDCLEMTPLENSAFTVMKIRQAALSNICSVSAMAYTPSVSFNQNMFCSAYSRYK